MIIFLDFDGVLINQEDYIRDKQRFLENRKNGIESERNDKELINKDCAKVLSNFIKLYDEVTIVISSSWRKLHRLPELKEILNYNGIYANKYSTTLNSNNGIRGVEIQDWLDKNNINDESSYVIIDDEIFDIKDYFPSENIIYVQGGYMNNGLQQSHIDFYLERIIKKEREK